MLRRILIAFICAATVLSATATADTGLRKYAGEFMAIDVSARAQAMGGAFTALSNDVYATFYNPAGLAQLRSPQLGFTHTQQFLASVNYDYIGFSKPFSTNKTLGISLIRLGIDNIKDTRAAAILDEQGILRGIDQSQIDNFNSADYVVYFSLGQQITSNLLLGINTKLIRRDLADNSANGLGFDVGLLYNLNNRWKISGVLRNATTTLIAWDTGEKELVSPTLRMGSSYLLPIPVMNGYLIPNFDLVVQTENVVNLTESAFGSGYISGAFGGELVLSNRLFLRGGYDELQRVNFGVGISIPHINVDYSFTSYDQELGNAHRIGLLIDFGQ